MIINYAIKSQGNACIQGAKGKSRDVTIKKGNHVVSSYAKKKQSNVMKTLSKILNNSQISFRNSLGNIKASTR